MASPTRKKIVAALGTVALGAGIALARWPSAAALTRGDPAPIPRITEVWTPGCGMMPVFAGARPALDLDPTDGRSDPAAFDRLSGLPYGGAWCFNGNPW
jgi:hypothetical protein